MFEGAWTSNRAQFEERSDDLLIFVVPIVPARRGRKLPWGYIILPLVPHKAVVEVSIEEMSRRGWLL